MKGRKRLFLVNSPKGTMFLKSIDESAIFKTTEKVLDNRYHG